MGEAEGTDLCDKLWLVNSSVSAFNADIDRYTVLVDHAVRPSAPSSGSEYLLTSRQMDGLLYVGADSGLQRELCAKAGNAVDGAIWGKPTREAPCYLPPKTANGLDYFSMGTLMQAMGIDLDAASYPGSGQSVRYTGMVVSLVIEYFNTVDWHGRVPTRYVYRPVAIPQSSYTGTEIVTLAYPDVREKKDVHGILITVQPGGKLADFDFTALLVQLTTSLTLLATATVVVNMMAQYVLRYRTYYREAMFEETTDFMHVAELEGRPDEEVDRELRRRHLPVGGSKERRLIRLLEDGWTPRDASSLPEEASGRQQPLVRESEASSAEGLSLQTV